MKSTRKLIIRAPVGSLLLVHELLGSDFNRDVRIHVSLSLAEVHFPPNQDLTPTPPFVGLYLQALMHEDL